MEDIGRGAGGDWVQNRDLVSSAEALAGGTGGLIRQPQPGQMSPRGAAGPGRLRRPSLSESEQKNACSDGPEEL